MNKNNDTDILSIFGLNAEQMLIMFSYEKLLVEKDILGSKNDPEIKQIWLKEWTESIIEFLSNSSVDKSIVFLNEKEIFESVKNLLANDINNTWYYLIMLELTLFKPYTSLSKDLIHDKAFAKLKYKEQTETIKEFVRNSGVMEVAFIDRFKKTYSKSISKISGTSTKIALGVVSTVAIAAIVAASAGALAGPIAVYLFGSQFAGLTGAALTSACLAMAGGGAIAIGGTGIAGGTLAIVGGGALLGLAGGGTFIGSTAMYVASLPQLTLSQAAKLEVVLKEIVVNAQKDVKSAQSVLENYKNQIVNLHTELTKLRLDGKNNKELISAMKKSLDYMEVAYKSSNIFVSSYDLGTNKLS